MKYFITGGTGFIGRRLVDRLAQDKSNQLICLTRNLAKSVIPSADNIQMIEGDLIRPETYERFLEGTDCLFHLGASVGYGIYGKKRKEMEKTNIEGTKIILETVSKLKIPKIIYLSTAMIYHPMGEKIVSEQDNFPKKHTTHYSHTKYLGYLESQKLVDLKLPMTILLPTSVYGKGSPLFEDFTNFLLKYKIFFKNLLDKKISIVHVDDVVNAIILAQDKTFDDESFIISNEIITMKQLINNIEKHFHIKIRIFDLPKFILKPSSFLIGFFSKFKKDLYINKEIYNFIDGNFTASGQKALEKLGWKPAVSNNLFLD